MLTLWRNARIATCDEHTRVFEHGALVTDGGVVAWVGDADEMPAGLRPGRTIELAGRWITPGLIDCHTHLVFAGQRAAEFARRTSGASYSQIAREGGGILSTVRATRAAGEDELLRQSLPRLESLLQEGVTTVEIKSGYGLEFETEARMLRVARRLEASRPVTVATSFLAAHALPPEFAGRADEYINTICEVWLPRLMQDEPSPPPSPALGGRGSGSPLPLAGEGAIVEAKAATRGVRASLIDCVDSFCEDIAFSVAQCERMFATAQALGLPVRMHAEQLSNIGGSQLAARYGALSADHLEYTTDADAAALAAAGTVAVLLPVAFYALAEKRPPPVEALRKRGVPIAVASDCNPGSAPGASLLLAMNMARRLFGLTSEEVLAGTTRHAARALRLQRERGALQAGLAADLAVWSVDSLDELGYWAGFNPCSMVVKDGEIALERAV